MQYILPNGKIEQTNMIRSSIDSANQWGIEVPIRPGRILIWGNGSGSEHGIIQHIDIIKKIISVINDKNDYLFFKINDLEKPSHLECVFKICI